MKLTQAHHFCVLKSLLSNYIYQFHYASFSHPGPHFYCFYPGPYVFFKYSEHNHFCCLMWEKHLFLIKHTCS